ncbi:MAG TPA: adenylate/guanylate cyclase domain-containing protein [Solirubrobacterales bacterium]|jgi:class 3 adenylate cyclase|nr:adenylate/guanylate cyclase domain-containing protein [Solirubrobacterales bacterium]
MADSPVRYAIADGLHLAYRTWGAGDQDICLILPGFGTIELLDEPPAGPAIDRFARHSRLISFDRRGTGLSDPITGDVTLEEQMEDVIAVLDACGCERVVIWAESEGAMLATVFAATHPERVSHLVLLHPMARMTVAEDYPAGWADEETRNREFVEAVLAQWGSGQTALLVSPVLASRDPGFIEWWGRWERMSMAPGPARRRIEWLGRLDIRPILPRVQTPALIVDRPDALTASSEHARYFAEHVPGAELRELPGRDAISFGDGFDEFAGAIEEFTRGGAGVADHQRALATVMFTDIVGSTELAAERGDRDWRELLERHDRITRDLVGAYGGVAVKSTGDGFLATFDGPARAVRCATDLGERVGDLGIRLRAGLHTGEVEVIGADVGGMAVHIGARIGALGDPGEVLASSTVKDLVVGSGIEFAERGSHSLKGVPGEWKLFAVDSV